jgi:hypothetical protein
MGFDPVSFAGGFGAGEQVATDKGAKELATERYRHQIALDQENIANSELSTSAIMMAGMAIKTVQNLREENAQLLSQNETLTNTKEYLKKEIQTRWIPYSVKLKANLMADKAERSVFLAALRTLDPINADAIAKKADEASDVVYDQAHIQGSEVNKQVIHLIDEESKEMRTLIESRTKSQ